MEEIVCLGPDGTSSSKTEGHKCDAKAGKFYPSSPAESDVVLPAWETRVAKGEDGEKKARCWGTVAAGSVECAAGELCNPAGTTSAGYTELADAVTEVCIKAEDFAATINGLCKKDGALTDGTEGVTYCAPAEAADAARRAQDATAEAAEAVAANPDYCDTSTGLCVADDPAIADTAGKTGETDDTSSPASSKGVLFASVAVFLSM